MDSSIPKLDKLRANPQHQTQLAQICGTDQLFRNRYQILRTLGRGGFGVTYLAKDASLPNSPVCVIKLLCPKVSNPVVLQRACQRFEREAKILSQLGSHAQIPRLLDYFQVDGEFYLVQEYIRGRTLAKEIKSKGTLSELEVKQFLREILPVLSYIHEHQVIHRDIKPPNIIRCQDDGRLVLIDFGAVKEQFVQVSQSTQRGTTTHFVGTLGFAPPEQLALRATYSSDIFALGVTCLYMLTGKPPMEFSYDSTTGEVNWQDYVTVSEHFGKILDKMLKVSVRDRYQSADEILRILNLEPYLGKLSDCLHIQPRLSELPDEAALLARNGYLPPIVRAAIAIRRWRARMMLRDRKRKVEQEGELLINEVN
ncbi:serine/threonine-protein kinase [Leptolyngbya sp. 7M]|uniref:serine/threonine-protein kinase n=1 Tax=Leptolyngbya sp. 7M TaxID=2812896 RepID=UPI001B8B0951|nr:serine/threonine-protein kinase [Leptolyngbya sp. 7M]QYO66840.1 serine/threonine protein kinase [Leptolyngbya sp. 7M]